MGWQSGNVCDGFYTERGDLRYCSKCGYQDDYCSLNERFQHTELPPRYSQEMGAAWRIIQMQTAKMGYDNFGFSWRGPIFKPEHHYLDAPSQHDCYVFGNSTIRAITITGTDQHGQAANEQINIHYKGDYGLGGVCWFIDTEQDGLCRCFAADTPQDVICIAALVLEGIEVQP